MPTKTFDGKINIIKDANSAKIAIASLSREKILGFDTESKPAFRKGENYLPSLIQLATKSEVYIFQIKKIEGIMTMLRKIFENAHIAKVGVGVDSDVKKLNKIGQFSAAGFHDIGHFSKSLSVMHTGLRNLAAIFLRVKISKQSQLTDWSQDQLSAQQISYAATDAWISREIFVKMEKYF